MIESIIHTFSTKHPFNFSMEFPDDFQTNEQQ